MKLADIAQEVAKQTSLPIKSLESSFRLMFDQIKNMSEGESISIMGFGSFKRQTKKSRVARDPRNGNKVITEPKSVVVFKYNGKKD